MSDEKRIVEINGVKVEVDLRAASQVQTFKVGDNVKVLIKGYSSYASYFGVIVGFDDFKCLPTIVVAYLEIEYSETKVKFAYINNQSKDMEICHAQAHEKVIDKNTTIERLDKEISKLQKQIEDLEYKKQYFLTYYEKSFEDSGE